MRILGDHVGISEGARRFHGTVYRGDRPPTWAAWAQHRRRPSVPSRLSLSGRRWSSLLPLSILAPRPSVTLGLRADLQRQHRVRAQVVPLLPAIALSLRRTIATRLAAQPYDVVHAHWVLPNGWAATSVANAAKVPVVVTLHGTDVAMAEGHRLLARVTRRTFERVAAVTATSDNLRGRAVALGADPRHTTTTYLGVDTDLFAPRPAAPEMRELLGGRDGCPLVVSVGRLAQVKGFEYLIGAVTRLEGVTLAIVGDGELRAELERLAETASPRIRLVGGMPHDRVAQAFAAADVVVVPSVVDDRGRVDATTSTALEALASGRPRSPPTSAESRKSFETARTDFCTAERCGRPSRRDRAPPMPSSSPPRRAVFTSPT